MYVFMNEYYNDNVGLNGISGVQYYMIEMMQFLKDKYNIQNIKELVNPLTETNRNIVHSRYTHTFDMIETLDMEVEKLFVSMNSLLYLLQSNMYQYILNNVKQIYLLNANGILELFRLYIKQDRTLMTRYKQISKKIFLLHEIGFENDFIQKGNLKIVPIIRGLYFKYFKYSYNMCDNYFMFITEHSTVQSYTEKDLQKAHQYSLEQNIEYTTEHCINPASQYKGLIYFRYHDYMPRLPYEFWYYNKDVRLVQISDGLQKRMKQYGQNIFDWNLDEVMK